MKKKILLIDDSAMNRKLVLLQCDKLGFRVSQIGQGKAQSEENGYSLFKDCNAALADL